MPKAKTQYPLGIVDEVIEMAWCDKTTFDAIETHTGLPEHEVIRLMRLNLKARSYALWRKRVTGRSAKHKKLNLR